MDENRKQTRATWIFRTVVDFAPFVRYHEVGSVFSPPPSYRIQRMNDMGSTAGERELVPFGSTTSFISTPLSF